MTDRVKKLRETLQERILVLDGATGTALADIAITPEVFGGEKYEGLYEALNIHSPELVLHLHKTYIDAGADIIETNTFSGSSIVLEEYGLESRTHEINRRAAELAREAIEKYGKGKPLWVAGSMGPSTKTIQVTGGIDFDGVIAQYYPQIMGLIEGGVDYLLVETSQDTLNIKAILQAVERANKELGTDTPVSVSLTIEATGTMLAGQNIESATYTLAAFDLLYLGLNCATGPEFMTDHLRTLAGLYPGFVAVVPNAGLPNVEGEYDESALQLSDILQRFAKNGWVNLVGGCCGTTDEYIRMINEKVAALEPRVPPKIIDKSATAGSEALILEEDNRPVLVGERTNVIGSRKFKRLVTANRFEEAAEVGRSQARGGAGILDLFEDTRGIAEPSGALAVAGMKKWLEKNGHGLGRTLVAIQSGANMNFHRLRHVSERAEFGEGREAILSVTIPE
ncbi:MAG: homocysteine S-methyltransferase family protein, partial [Candidatus Marinimicrobia bacterium]|nr:homocysteine S-methyltransferase family protein [Candidatus Neomarinimicrobiota bacterium]